MLAAIASARKTVNFAAYIFWWEEVGTRFRDALAERAYFGPLLAGKRLREWLVTPIRSEL